MIKKLKNNNILIYAIIIFLTLINNFWVINKNNFFYGDDIDHLVRAKNIGFHYLDNINKLIIPQQYYNDRPFGSLFISFLYSIFHLNYIYYHFIFLTIHIINALLVYFFINKVLFNLKQRKLIAFLGALIFGSWFRANFAVQWIAAVFDLLGLFFALIYLNLSCQKNKNSLMRLFFLIIAIRTKEAFIFLPLFPIVFFFLFKIKNKKQFIIDFLIFLFYFFIYLIFKKNLPLPISDPYYTSLKPIDLFFGVLKYFGLYFTITQIGLDLSKRFLSTILFFILIIIISFWKKENRLPIFLLLIGFVISLMTIAPLINKQDPLYLYTPSIFLSSLISLSLITCFSKLFNKKILIFITIIFLLLINLINPLKISEINWWLDKGKMNRISFYKIPSLPKKQSYYIYNIVNVGEITSLFFYNSGHLFKLFNFEGKTYSIKKEDIDKLKKEKNFCLINFNQGDFIIDYCR